MLLLLLARARDGRENCVLGGREVGVGVGDALGAGLGWGDPGRRRPVARRVGRAVELGEAVAVQLAVFAQEACLEGDAEGAVVVELPDRLLLVGLAGAGPALDGYLKPCNDRCEDVFLEV